MREKKYSYGIIFDMDNTLLQSAIDFTKMKRSVFELLVDDGLCAPNLDWHSHTASQLIEMARQSGKLKQETEARIWDAVTECEKQGMHGAQLEPYVPEVLAELCEDFHLVVLTNNACIAAQEALKETGIGHYFDHIVGREQMTALKPSASGVYYVLDHYPDVPAENWMFVGDSWIDGKAAKEGNIAFIAYKGNRNQMEKNEVYPVAHIEDMRELMDSLMWRKEQV